MKIVWILLVAAAVYLLQRYLYKTYWKKGLQVQVRFSDGHVYEGDETRLMEEITNDKRLPLPAVEIRFAMDKALSYPGEAAENVSVSDKTYRRDVFSLFARQKNIRTFPVNCTRRGCYSIREAELVGYDFFFQEKYYDTLPQEARLYVYPRRVDTRRIRLICQALSGMRLVQNQMYSDPFAFAGIRAYDRSDPMRRINWKASAKSGELMVNQFDATTSLAVKCFLDVADRHVIRHPELVEESISIVTSLATQLAADRMDVEILGNALYSFEEGLSGKSRGTDGETSGTEELSVTLKAGANDPGELYRRMACIETDRITCDMGELLRREAKGVQEQWLYVLVSQNQDEDTSEGVRAMAANGARLLWVIPSEPVSAAKEEKPELPAQAKIMRWEVVR